MRCDAVMFDLSNWHCGVFFSQASAEATIGRWAQTEQVLVFQLLTQLLLDGAQEEQ